MSRAQTRLLRLRLHGLEIDIQCVEGLVVDLVVRTEQKQRAIWRRLLQYLAHALFRLAQRGDSRHDDGPIRVTELQILHGALKDGLPQRRDFRVFRRIPLQRAYGETNYQALAVDEGVEHGKDELLASLGIFDGRRVRADKLHPVPRETWSGRTVIVAADPDSGARGARTIAAAAAIALILGWLGPAIDAEAEYTAPTDPQLQAIAAQWEVDARRRCSQLPPDAGRYIRVDGGGIVCPDQGPPGRRGAL